MCVHVWRVLVCAALYVSVRAGGGERPKCQHVACEEGGAATQLNEFYYTVEGEDFLVTFKDGDYLKLECAGNVSLLTPSLPRFPRPVLVRALTLDACLPPAPFSLSDCLRALNVTLTQKLKLTRIPQSTLLSAQSLQNVTLTSLSIYGTGNPSTNNSSASGFLRPLDYLNDLELDNFPLDDVNNLPSSLRRLRVRLSSPVNLSAGALERLGNLTWLTLQDTLVRADPSLQLALQASPGLRSIALGVDSDTLPMWNNLENVTFFNGKELKLGGPCTSLKLLNIYSNRGRAANQWLGNCSNLEILMLWKVPNAFVPKLTQGTSLKKISARRCNLVDLPADMLLGADKLEEFDLSDNLLTSLPDGIFASCVSLVSLHLSGNRLSASRVLPLLAPLDALRQLWLDRNPLGDLCSRPTHGFLANDVSPLRSLTSLESLVVSQCGVTRVCADWRRDLRRLVDVRLGHNNITQLHYDDLQWTRDQDHPTVVDVGNNPLIGVVYSYEDYKQALQSTDTNQYTSISGTESSSQWSCSCDAYWFERALRSAPAHSARLPSPCAPHPLPALTCPAPDLCVEHCDCRVRLAGRDGEVSGEGVVAKCTATADGRLPRNISNLRELQLINSNLTDLRAEDISPELQLLDIRNNSVRELTAEAARALVADGRRVLLAGAGAGGGEVGEGGLRCDCDARPALLLLNAHAHQIEDYEYVRCADGRRVSEVRPDALCAGGAGVWGAAGGVVGGAALLALCAAGVLALRTQLLNRAKKLLVKLGVCAKWAHMEPELEEEESLEGWQYDAFVSFAHQDSSPAEELVARLEAAGWRVCVHYRDWAPGELIPAHIAASVRAARRSVLLLSEHFARSVWARAEAQAALAQALRSRARVLPVLLTPSPPDALPHELLLYLQSATYLRWDDPWFWDKLCRAMPRTPLPQPAPVPETNAEPSAGAA